MGMPRAIQAHKEGDEDTALIHYKRALDQGVKSEVLFQNLGALSRKKGEIDFAVEIYDRGINLYPAHIGLRNNRANILTEIEPAGAVRDYLVAIRLNLANGKPPESCTDYLLNVIVLQRNHGLLEMALESCLFALDLLGNKPIILSNILLILHDKNKSQPLENQFDLGRLQECLEQRILTCELKEQAELRLTLASQYMIRGDLNRAIEGFELGLSILAECPVDDDDAAIKRQHLVDVNSWNFGCSLLKAQRFVPGWSLYDYGLRTPAEGGQRWQRALRKPFSSSLLPLWRGESLLGKRLLLLEEQAIGDIMMFLSLVPSLQQECRSITVVVSERLKDIYKRSFEGDIHFVTHKEVRAGNIHTADFDFQCPLGSICQHRFLDIHQYSPINPVIKANSVRSKHLRDSYLSVDGTHIEKLVGISWKGGGHPGRIEQKSLPPHQFAHLLSPVPGIRFVSLQYGKCEDQVNEWRASGLDVIHDPRVNPLKDMNLWLDQVAACDAVISVANTTIHGAGGLDLPTMCLLSRFSDWRWLDSKTALRSYWYPSVGIAREAPEKSIGWSKAIVECRKWLKQGLAYPVGSVSG